MNSQSIYENCKFENLGKMELSYKNCSYSSVTRRVKAFARNHEDFCASTVKCGDGTSGYTVCKITKAGKCPSAEECANTDLEVPNELTMENILCRKIGAGGKVESIKSGCVPQGSVVSIEQTNGGGSYSTSSKAAK